ncbi:MAG: cytochrome C oxidase subunit II [Verrucomicrobia bacterium]|nr:cytochrome C oxidase subunit II [Verrucomicrobiota bacterium]
MIEAYVERASTYAGDIDNLFSMVFWIVALWFVAAEVVLFYFCFRYRKVDGVATQYITGEKKYHKKWISIPHYLVLFFDVFIVAGAIAVWYDVKQRLPEPDLVVGVIAQQWAWTFIHPGADGVLHTNDDITTIDELHIMENVTYHVEMESKDVLHSFSVPVFRLKQDVIPGRKITGWFKATKTGEWDIQCTEICGIGHGLMPARIHIKSAYDHKQWVEQNSPNGSGQALASISQP